MKNYNVYYTLLICMVISVVAIYLFPSLRYTKYIQPPVIYSMPAKDVDAYIDKNPNKFLFLDVRSKGEYVELHAKNSISFPIADMYEDKKRVTLPYDKDTKIFLICTSGRLAGVAYRFLEHHGYRNIEHIDKGIGGWVDAGLPVISKKDYEESNTEIEQ